MMIKGLTPFTNKNRSTKIADLSDTEFDLIVIGGGITGAGVMLDASLRGMKVLLLEKHDFASGTSSKSTKLIHGGLRYLKQLEFALVRETGLERSIAHRNACHLVHPENMLLPIVKNGSFNKLSASLAISMYDRLAKVSKEQRKKGLTKQEIENKEPLLKKNGLRSGILYAEYRTDDARLTIEVIKAAVRNGGHAFNYMEVQKFRYSDDTISGVVCRDHTNDEEVVFRAKHVISSSGPWVDAVSKRDNASSEANLFLSKGSHIVLDKVDFPIQQSTYFDVFDGRMIFAIPRGKIVYVGTTDTEFTGDLENIRCSEEDAEYLINAIKAMFDVPTLSIKHVKSTWAGVRPLIREKNKGPSEISRKDEVFVSDSGLISIAGGKLTGYRKMAKKVVNLVAKRTPGKFENCRTKRYKIHHAPFDNYREFLDFVEQLELKFAGTGSFDFPYLVRTYGKDSEGIIQYSIDKEIDIELATVDYCLNYEAVYRPLDYVDRRSGNLFFDIDKAKQYQERQTAFIGDFYHKDEAWIREQQRLVQKQIESHGLTSMK